MNVREKLVELLDNAIIDSDDNYGFPNTNQVADRLIANGVTVQELDGCKYCKEYEDLPEHFIDSEPVGRVFDTCIQPNENGLWHLEVPCGADIGIRFCPMCGRELPKPPKTVDAVEVVRCSECIGRSTWYNDAEYGCAVCGMSGMYPKNENGYCSYGLKRNNE